jgi:nitrogen-specific signal transduction histidine kinase
MTDLISKRVIAVARDVTEHRALEAQLRHSQKMDAVGQLAGGVAHDFNNLIQAILGNLHFAFAAAPDAELRGYLADIESAAERAATLTKQLLAFSRRAPLRVAPVALNELIREFMLLLRRVIPVNITVDFIAGHQLAAISGDRGQIEQVLMNLVLNARDAMPNGGRLTLETENILVDGNYAQTHPWASPGRYVLLTVSDTGVGLTTKSVSQGSGLGLAVAYGIVEQHNGSLQVYSEPGHGTTFKLYLPVAERLATAVGSKVDALRSTVGTETVLLAEDEPLVRSVLTRALERAGYRVLAAANGSEALKLCREHDDIALALLDVVMPDCSGPEVYARIQEFRPGLRTLFASGYSDTARSTHDIPVGSTVLSKPFEIELVLARVRELLDE